MREVTTRQLQYLEFIVSYTDAHGYAPSTRDIGAAMGFISPNAVHDALNSLERKGMITRARERARSIVVTTDGRYVIQADDGLNEAAMAADDSAAQAPGDEMAADMARWLHELQKRRGRAE